MAQEVKYVPVLESDQLPEGRKQAVKVNGTEILLVRLGGAIYAVDLYCTHEHEPLIDGDIEEGEIVCPFHGARFEINSGKAMGWPAVTDLNTYLVREKDGKIEVAVPI